MAGVQWKYDTGSFVQLKAEITGLFAKRNAIPAIGLQYYPFCEFIKNSDEWVINRHFFFKNMKDTSFNNLLTGKSFNGKISIKDWINSPSKYDNYVLEVIGDILLKHDIFEVEFCGLSEYNVTYLRVETIKNLPIWTMTSQRSI